MSLEPLAHGLLYRLKAPRSLLMALSIYKSGRGYWVRMMSALGFGTLVLAGVAWGWAQMDVINDPILYQAAMAVAVIVVAAVIFYYLLGINQKIVDFMIATEDEMKKVNWPSKKEIIGSTWVVIAGTLLIAAVLFAIDVIFGFVFTEIGILGV